MKVVLYGRPGQAWDFSYHLFLVLTAIWFRLGDTHIGESCSRSIFPSRCFLSTTAFCDIRDNICKCKPQYPVKISAHKCGIAKSHQEDCYVNEECSYNDENAYCNLDTIRNVGSCDCLPRYTYSKSKGSCQLESTGGEEGPSYTLPTIIGIIISCCVGLFICFSVIPMLRGQSSLRESLSTQWSIRRRSRRPSRRQTESPSAPPTETNNDALPSYEAAVLSTYDDQDPPPEYEVAVKSAPPMWIKESG